MRWLILSLLLVLVFGANVVPPAGARQQAPRFVTLSKEQGLPDNTVEAIAEDHRGFMWFGTPDGLARYDAHSLTVYRHDPQDPQSLSSSYVLSLLEDRENGLWIGTLDGLNAYRRDRDSFTRYRRDDNEAANHINEIYEDRRGDLWIGTGWGVSRFDRASRTFVHYLPEEYSPEDPGCGSNVRVILEDRDGDLWLGIDECGLVRLDRRTGGAVQHHRHDRADPASLGNDDVRDLYEDPDGGLWVATMGGLSRLDRSTGSFTRFHRDPDDPRTISTDFLDALLIDRDGSLWIGTDGSGIDVFDRGANAVANFRRDSADDTTLGSDVIRTIYEDSRGDVWVGTYTGGVAFYSRNTTQFSYHRHLADDPNSLSHSAVLSFFEEQDGSLWIGTEGGLNHFDPQTGTFRRYLHDERDPRSLSADAVLAILRDSRGYLWAGTYHGGLNRLQPETETFLHYQYREEDPRSLSNPHVWDIFEDRAGGLWIGTFRGVNRFDYDSETFVRYLHDSEDDTSIGHEVVWDLYEDRAGTLWLATLWGLSRYQREEDNFRTYRHDEEDGSSLSHNRILSILEDSEGRLWVGTEGGGLNLFDRETATARVYRTADGLPNDKVYGILEDSEGRLWISTNEGLSRFDPVTERFTDYSRSDGLLAYPFFRNSCLKTRDGEMYFGGVNGFSGFHPESITDNPFVPPVVLTDFQIFNQPVLIGDGSPLERHITEAERIRLRHDQSVISFTFSALNYRAPERNRYAYRLEGFDRDWSHVSTKRSATYTNLDPGRYTFRVKGANNSGLWNEEGTAVEIVVLPPYWATWWFRALSLLAAAGLVLGVHQVRTRTIRARNLALQAEIAERRRVEAEHERLLREMEEKSATLEQQNAELERFAYTVSHDLKTPLVTIKGFIGLLARDARAGDAPRMEKDIERITSAAERMSILLDELLELSRIGRLVNPPEAVSLTELAREAVELVAGKIEEKGVAVCVEPGMPTVVGDRVRLQEVYQNLVDNAVKFVGDQPEPRLEVGARADGAEVECWVRDNGIGVDPRYHRKVFGLFERLDANEEGTGVGLALVKRIVEVHGGRIWVESEGAGRGSTFRFTLSGANGPA